MLYTWAESPLGQILLVSNRRALTGLYLSDSKHGVSIIPDWKKDANASPFPLARAQLDEYFNGHRKSFQLPLEPQGTIFQLCVWQALMEIPYASTISYRELATRIGKPTSARAVGQANGHNPISIIVPCHRVIGVNGSLTGYGGGIQRKAALLNFEQAVFVNGAHPFPREN